MLSAAGVGSGFAEVAFSGSLLLAVPVAVLAGLVSFASPCVLPLVPGYLGYLGGMSGAATVPAVPALASLGAGAGSARSGAPATGTAGGLGASTATRPGRGRLLLGVGLFVAGFTAVFLAYGTLAGSLGGLLQRWQDPLSRGLGVVVVVMGLAFLGLVPFLQQDTRPHLAPRAGLWGAPLLGLTFGIGWTPCIGPTLGAIILLSLDGGSPGRGAVLSLAFCLGLGIPFLLVALGIERSARALGFLRRHRLAVMRVGGAMLVALGLALVTGLWSTWANWLQGLLTGSQPFVPVV
ncbi:cytochrome C biogenesis protein CcdA [Actinomycetota bacterium]|nr:cytochrome C biogenesis protein CcdA [Actinomycetota bacterium]